jgi:hypothetical protein
MCHPVILAGSSVTENQKIGPYDLTQLVQVKAPFDVQEFHRNFAGSFSGGNISHVCVGFIGIVPANSFGKFLSPVLFTGKVTSTQTKGKGTELISFFFPCVLYSCRFAVSSQLYSGTVLFSCGFQSHGRNGAERCSSN